MGHPTCVYTEVSPTTVSGAYSPVREVYLGWHYKSLSSGCWLSQTSPTQQTQGQVFHIT